MCFVLCCSFQLGLWPGMALSAVDTVLLRGNAPWTLHHRCASLVLSCLLCRPFPMASMRWHARAAVCPLLSLLYGRPLS